MRMLKPRFFEAVLAVLLLFLCVVMFMVVTAGNEVQFDAWNLTSAGPVSDIQVGDDGTLYVFSGEYCDTISAISPGGKVMWAMKMPANWGPADRFFKDEVNCVQYRQGGNIYGEKGLIYTTDRGNLYLYIGEIRTTDPDFTLYTNTLAEYSPASFGKYVVAISAEGEQLWKTEIRGSTLYAGDASLYAENGTIYVYDGDVVVGLDSAGHVVSTIGEILSEPAVDEAGNLYVIKGFPGIQNPVESYGTDATLRWRTIIPGQINYYYQPDSRDYNPVLLYHNHTLSIPVKNGIFRLDDTGNITGVTDMGGISYSLFEPMPIDSQGNLYLVLNTVPSYTHVVSPDGKVLLRNKMEYNGSFKGDHGGVVYKVDYYLVNQSPATLTKADLMYANLTAYDIFNDRYLWSYTYIPDGHERYASADADSDIGTLFQWSVSTFITKVEANPATPGRSIQYSHRQKPGYDYWIRHVPDHPDSVWGMRLVSGQDVIYVNYYTGNRETWYGSQDYVFSNKLYAMGKNGTLLWEKELQSPITSMAINNSTLYYGTHDGRLFAENTGLITGGLAIAAILYLFIRFFLAGTVARAKDRLNKNENRNGIVKYVENNPGSTLRDISRGLGMNIGTVRYHMLILGINHRISSIQADDKHVRYFPATAQYSTEDRLVMSLARREGMKKVMVLLMEKQGLSNSDLSRELNMKESAVSRYMKVLTDRGVVDRREVPGGSLSYSINSKLAESVGRAIKQEKN